MKIWRSYGSEHSMDLVLVGTFESAALAATAQERMEALRILAEAEWSDDHWQRPDERMPRQIINELAKLSLYDMGRHDVDIYALDHTVTRDDAVITVKTEESDIQGFLKVLLNVGARVEIFSRHRWNEDRTPKIDAEA